jgi:MtfA peptidase
MISIQEIYQVLLFEFPFFKKINEDKRQLLCKRTQHFIHGTDFIGRKEMEMTNRVKILISACSQQLTLAFPKHYDYKYFEKIIVYPEKYFSSHTQRYHTGEMNTAGAIVLSWEDFYKGMSIDDNSRNVGLHEFAHALEFMDIAKMDVDPVFSACLDKFTAMATHYLQNQPEKPLFRSYATTNLSEFFAVATEYYFEGAADFVVREPELFDLLRKAYQQDMAPTFSKINKRESPKIDSIIAFDNSGNFKDKLLEFSLFVLVTLFCGFFIVKLPIVGVPLCLISFFLLHKFVFSDGFILYENHIIINRPFYIQLIKLFGFSNNKINTTISYSDVLYLSISDTFYQHEHYDTRRSYIIYYLQNGKMKYAKELSYTKEYESILSFFYLNKQVGTRLNGIYKKYKP